MPAEPPAGRAVVVARLSLQEELANVVRGAATIVAIVWFYLAVTVADSTDGRRALLPYQSLIQTYNTADQRMFRGLQEGLLEAEAVRSTTGAWPLAEALALEGIPPFAPDPTMHGARYRWTRWQTGSTINYLGRPDVATAPGWLLMIQEPEPGVPPDQRFDDQEHHTLVDGTMLHVSTWSHPQGVAAPERLTIAPQTEGWQQVYAVGPAATTPATMAPAGAR